MPPPSLSIFFFFPLLPSLPIAIPLSLSLCPSLGPVPLSSATTRHSYLPFSLIYISRFLSLSHSMTHMCVRVHTHTLTTHTHTHTQSPLTRRQTHTHTHTHTQKCHSFHPCTFSPAPYALLSDSRDGRFRGREKKGEEKKKSLLHLSP